MQRPDCHNHVEVITQRGQRVDRLHVNGVHLHAEQSGDTGDEPDVVLDDVNERQLGPVLGEGQGVEAEPAPDVQDPLAGDSFAVQKAVPTAYLKRPIEIALRAPELEQLAVGQLQQLRALRSPVVEGGRAPFGPESLERLMPRCLLSPHRLATYRTQR